MPQSLSGIFLHLVFSTKLRIPFITDPLRGDLHAYMTGILEQQQCPLVQINSVPDHIHILFALGRTRAISEVVQELKVASSHWFKRRGVSAFAWQAGYGVFSVSQAELPDIKRYIVNQTEHHRVVSFQEEYRQFMARHHLPFDERYGWD